MRACACCARLIQLDAADSMRIVQEDVAVTSELKRITDGCQSPVTKQKGRVEKQGTEVRDQLQEK